MPAPRRMRALLAAAGAAAALGKPTLQVKEDGTFKLALFCDMHYGEGAAKDAQSSAFQKTILQLEQPDLVVIDGDASSNYAAPWFCRTGLPWSSGMCQSYFMNNWKHFTAPLEDGKTPYAYTLGNHDRIPGGSKSPPPGIETDYAVPDHWILKQDLRNNYSLTEDGPASIHGASNYVLPILGRDGKPVFYIWLLDSSDNNCEGTTGWGCVYPDQVAWYQEKSKELIQSDGRVVPGLMFHHIPLDEVNKAWNDPSIEVFGDRAEEVCCFSVNTGLFDAIKATGNIWGVFSGHDHNNDFFAVYEGVRIGFGRKSGYGGYGGAVSDKHGSRVFQLHVSGPNVTVDTWIREEKGTRVVQTPTRNRVQGKPVCCGTTSATQSLELGAGSRLLIGGGGLPDAERCRAFDDVGACRRAAGLDEYGESYIDEEELLGASSGRAPDGLLFA